MRHSGQRERPAHPRQAAHMLSFDVEEYFQVEAAARGAGPDRWGTLEKRLAPCVERVCQLLSDHAASATFFVLGWVAEHEPEVVRTIARAGHEIASHGMTHSMLARLTPEQFRRELLDSRAALEDISARPVVGFRAATFSITHKTAWALDCLAEAGYQYDSSIFPVRHDRYGVPEAPRFVHRAIGPGGGEVVEVPPLTMRILGINLPVGGGGYLRLFPVRPVARALRRAERLGREGMIYLHPWELDPDQPVLPMSWLNRRRHRVNLARTGGKLRWLLKRLRFQSVERHLASGSGRPVESFRYGRGR